MLTSLTTLGFSENEVSVYLTVLRLWSAVVGTIAKEADMPRATTYQILDRLIQKGLIFEIDRNNILTYVAEEPERILKNLEKEEREVLKKQRIRKKRFLKLLTSEKDAGYIFRNTDSECLRETRILPEGFGNVETMVLFDNSTLLMTDNYPFIGIEIIDRQTHEMMESFFSFVWWKTQR